jgi:hypothetical protein
MRYFASNPLRRKFHVSTLFFMVMTVLWAELWSVVARCNLAGNVGTLQQNYFDKLDTRSKKGGTF